MSSPREMVLAAAGLRGPSPALRGLLGLFRRVWSFGITTSGKLLTASVLLAGAIGATSINVPIYHLFFALASLWGAAFIAAWWCRPKLVIGGSFPGPCTAGDIITVDYPVKNIGRRAARDLGLALLDATAGLGSSSSTSIARLQSGAAGNLTLEIRTLKRGLYGPMRVKAFSSFPLDLFRIGGSTARKDSLLVYPKFTPLAALDIDVGRKFQPGGIALTSNTGESPEYIGNREYRAGDPIRRIDFKAWARLAKPAVREYQEEYFCRVALVIDTFIPPSEAVPAAGNAAMEAAISLCAAIADRLALGEYIIDLFAAGPELYVFRAGRSTAHFENVLEILACVDPTRANPFETVTPALADELGNVTTLICVLLDWDEARQALVRAALDSGCAVKAILVRDGAPSVPLDQSEVDIVQFDSASVHGGHVEAL